MTLHIHTSDGVALVSLGERLDGQSAAMLRGQLLPLWEAGPARVVLDLSAVEFIDTAGVGVLVSLHRRAQGAGGDVRLVAPQAEPARYLLQQTRLDLLFVVAPTVAEALNATAAAAGQPDA